MKGMCYDCGHILSPNELSDLTTDVVSMVHSFPDLLVNVEEAKQIGQRDTIRLVKQRKLILIVDLDHTLVHARPAKNFNILLPKSDKVDIHRIKTDGRFIDVAIRPGSQKFLESLTSYFELHVFTLGTRDYAHQVVSKIDPDNKLIHDRIRSRCDSTSIFSKEQEIVKIFPTGEHMVVILDDRRDVWAGMDNIIQVLPFFFFDEEEINPSHIFSQNFTESTLRNIETYCQEIPYFDFLTKRLLNFHNLFYKTFDICEGSLSTYDDFEYDQYLDDKSRPNLKNIISVEHSKILSDCKIVFSGIIPRDRDITDNQEYLIATFLGAEVLDALSESVTHLVANKTTTKKVSYIIDSHLPIHLVNVDWIYCCYYLGTRVLETAFSIEAAKPSDSNQNPSNILLPTSTKRKSKEICVEECPAKLIPSVLEDFLDDNTLNEILQDLDDDPLDSQNNSDNDKNDKEYINIKKTPSTESGDQISWQTSSSSNGEDVNQDELEDYAKKLNSYFL